MPTNEAKIRIKTTGAKAAEKDFDRLGKTSKGFAKSFKIAGASLVALGATTIFTGKKLLALASEAEEVQSKFDTVFKGMEQSMNMWAEDFAKGVGRSRTEIKDFSSSITDILKPMGLQTKAAAELSKKTVQLALDVASFNNRQDKDVVRAFTSALTGERESLKSLGILITEADVKQEAYTAGIIKAGEELTKEAKAQATINLLFKNTADAQGDLERTSESYANQVKTLRGQLKDLGTDIGELVLPEFTEFVKFLNVVAIPAATGYIAVLKEEREAKLTKEYLAVLKSVAATQMALFEATEKHDTQRVVFLTKVLHANKEILADLWKQLDALTRISAKEDEIAAKRNVRKELADTQAIGPTGVAEQHEKFIASLSGVEEKTKLAYIYTAKTNKNLRESAQTWGHLNKFAEIEHEALVNIDKVSFAWYNALEQTAFLLHMQITSELTRAVIEGQKLEQVFGNILKMMASKLLGAGIGAILGSVIPGMGTVAGAWVGAGFSPSAGDSTSTVQINISALDSQSFDEYMRRGGGAVISNLVARGRIG